MKKFGFGCFGIIVLTFGLYISFWIKHEIIKDTIKINSSEISRLDQSFIEIENKWYKIINKLKNKYSNGECLSKGEFISLLKKSKISFNSIKTLNELILDNSSIDFCENEFEFEIFISREPIIFGDSYRHYISLDPNNKCENLISRHNGHNVIKNKRFGKKIRYRISKQIWD
jgi:hypothetical protein